MTIRTLIAACAALFAWPCIAAPLEAYGALPNIEAATISPDGTQLALISTNGEQRRIVTKDLKTNTVFSVIVGEAKVRSLSWADSRHLLIVSTTTARIMDVMAPRDEWAMLFSYDTSTRKLHNLMTGVDRSLNVLAGSANVREVGGKRVVLAEGVKFDTGGRGRIALFQADPDKGYSSLVHPGFPNTRDWVVGPDGQPFAEVEYDPGSGEWIIKIRQGTAWRVVSSGKSLRFRPYLMGMGRTPNTLLVGQFNQGAASVREVTADGVWSDSILDPDATILRDPVNADLIGYSTLVGDEQSYTFFDTRDQAAWTKVKAAFPGDAVVLQSFSADRRKLVVLVDSATLGPAYALVDLDSKNATWIGGSYEGLAEADISPVRPVRYKAADGLPLSGYLTTPRGKPLKGLPLVVLPHGGPASRDAPGFDWWAQALASRGYAVLQVNFRGSDGFGWNFMSAGFGQWGRKMQTDLSDGVRHLAADGVIDAKRVCIVGASYGGYAALAGATLDAGVYRCAASVAGLSDLGRFITWSRNQNGAASQRYWTNFMGVEGVSDPKLDDISPVANVAKVTAPILLIHGRDDTVTPFSQSTVMADALKAAGKPHEMVSLPGEDHWLSRGETRKQMLASIVAFLEEHNPPT